MKRILLLSSVLLISVFLVGCGKSHKLSCTMTQANAESKIVAYFNSKEDRLVKMKMSLTIDLGDEKAAKQYKKTACDDNDYDNCKTSIDGSKVTVSYQQNKIKKDEQSTLTDARKELEEEGFTCKK